MSKYKPGSRISQMWSAYEVGGPEACTALGPSLSLAPSTIKAWVRMWVREKEGSAPRPKATKGDNDAPKLPKRTKGYQFNPTDKARVRCTYMPGRLGWLVAEGPEVSEVRWDDDFPEVYIINRFIEPEANANRNRK